MLEVRLSHRFAGFALDVAFAAPAGLTALFGHSGAGKSTVIKAVTGLLRPDAGRIVLNGEVLSEGARMVPAHRRRLGVVFQEARLFPHLSVRQNLLYGRWFARERRVGLEEVVALLGLEALLARRPEGLSGGEKQRVAIGRALLSQPRMLIMDEPLASLDHARKAEILPYLERLRDDAGLPILYVSHALPEVARLATTIVVLEAGRVRRAGAAADILGDPALAPALGLREAGSVIGARMMAQEADGLSRLETAAGPIWLPRIAALPGARLQLRIPAHEVILAKARPEGLSALNILPVVVAAVRLGEGPGAIVQVRLGDEALLVRLTRRSAEALGLHEGMACFAVLKSVALARGDIGG